MKIAKNSEALNCQMVGGTSEYVQICDRRAKIAENGRCETKVRTKIGRARDAFSKRKQQLIEWSENGNYNGDR